MSKIIKIKTLTLTNFRNVAYARYDLSDVCCFEGKNYIGKTNSILAILWLLTGKMFDGSSNDESLKPKHNTKGVVSVEIVFEKDGIEKIVKKEYEENWVKTRGASELRLEGHITTYTIDGIVQKTNKNALSDINDYLEINNDIVNKVSKLDVKQLLINPLYASEILEWKDLRDLIFRIIGDVSNEEIIAKHVEIATAKPILEKYYYDQNKALKFLKQEISNVGTSIERNEIIISEYDKCESPTVQEIQTARTQIAKITDAISDIKAGFNVENPYILLKEEEKNTLSEKISQKIVQEKEKFNNSILNVNLTIKVISERKDKFYNSLNDKKLELNTIISSIKNKQFESESCTKILNNLNLQRDRLKERYLEEYRKVFNYTSNNCPNCGYQLDKAEEEAARERFESEKANNLHRLNVEGKQISLDIESNLKLINNNNIDMVDLEKKKTSLEEEIQNFEKVYQSTKSEYDSLILSRPVFSESEELIQMRNDLNRLEEEIQNLKIKEIDRADDHIKIKELEMQMKPYEEIIGRQQIYLNNQNAKEMKLAELKNLNNIKLTLELQKEMVELFMKTKLEMLNDKIANFFGDEIKFILIEKNLKEGSYDQTCIPLICGKQTKFKDGSTSEKIITGIKLIECFKKSLGLPSLPILIDECGQLDNNSLSLIKNITNSQIIATRVNDKYDEPHLIVL